MSFVSGLMLTLGCLLSSLSIFEGWSHGFAQMLPLLPEVSSTLDLTAEFIASAFAKHDLKTSGQLKPPPTMSSAYKFTSDRKGDTSAGVDDEALSFTPRRKPRGGSDSRPNSPSPALAGSGGVPRAASGLRGVTSTPPPPGFLFSTESSTSSPDTSVSGLGIGAGTTLPLPVTPKSMIEFNVASAAAIVTPPVFTTPAAVESLPIRKEGKILENNHDLLDRRRQEAGYGLPEIDTPEEHFRPLIELSAPSSTRGRTVSDEELQGQYVGEEDLFARRRLDATYGMTHSEDQESSEVGTF